MKIATTSADFRNYLEDNSEYALIRLFKDTKFRYINLSQTTAQELLSDNDDDWKKYADACGEVAVYAAVRYVLSMHRV